KDVEAAAGVAIQTRAILFPHVAETASYSVSQDTLIEANQERRIPFTTITLPPPIGEVTFGGGELPKTNNQTWISDIWVVQSLYEGGRLLSATRSSRLIKEQALLVLQSTVADTLLSVSNAYDDVLRGAMQVEVRNASVTFLTAYRDDTTQRYNAGTVPEFDVIRQEVEVAN